MTADRAPVKWAARWMARLEAASPLIRMTSLVATGLSTVLIGLSQYGYESYARPVIAVGVIGGVLFVYLYAEGGVYNQQRRDKTEFGKNFAGPNHRIDDELIGRGVAAALYGRPLDGEEREAIKDELDAAYGDLRDGIDIEEVHRSEAQPPADD